MTYQIIDEPKTKAANYLIVPPYLILLAAIFLPLYIGPLWLIINGYLLGSPTFKKELLIIMFGTLVMTAAFLGFGHLVQTLGEEQMAPFASYFKILSRGLYFFLMYWVIALQNAPYELYSYIKEFKQ